LLNVISGPALFLAFSLFPSGRFVPRWTPWLVLAFTLMGIPYDFFPGWPFNLSHNAWLLLQEGADSHPSSSAKHEEKEES